MSKPLYFTVGGSPLTVPLDVNRQNFKVSIRTASTIEVCLEYPGDDVAVNTQFPAVGPAPTWVAAPTPGANGITVIDYPVAAIRLTGAGAATVLQQGLE